MKAKETKAFTAFVDSLGFRNPVLVRQEPNLVKFIYDGFSPAQAKKVLGKSKKHADNLFVFVLDKDKAVRVNTLTNTLWLGNGRLAVRAMLESIPKR